MSNWNPILQPPAPTQINQFPDVPLPVQVSQTNLKDQKKVINMGAGMIYTKEFKDQVLTITCQWKKIVSATVTPETPFSQTVSVTTGTSTTDTTTQSFSESLGVGGKLASISASMTETFSHSITLSKSKTVSRDFQIKSTAGSVSAIWWQKVYTYTINGTIIRSIFGSKGVSEPFTTKMEASESTFVSTQYPIDSGMELKGFEEF